MKNNNFGREIRLPVARSTVSKYLKKQCGYGGSIESNSVERNPLREEEFLQPLAVVE